MIVVLSTHVAHAGIAAAAVSTGVTAAVQGMFGVSNFTEFIAMGAANISYIALWLSHWWVVFTGTLLNTSIILTLHIKDFVSSTPGIFLVWQTLRDLSGMLIIFMLLWASFRIILGHDSKIGDLIKNIVIMGILINFSFFITSALIDASNIVSLALYNGIVSNPISTNNLSTTDIANKTISATGADTGLGEILLQHLSVQSIYDPKNTVDSNKGADYKAILLQGVVGTIIMVTVGFSFLLASLSFVARLIYLIVLLAFSPIWFAAKVIPGISKESGEWESKLISQLIFMPVYLLLLYASLRILTTTSVFTAPSGNVFQGTGASFRFIPTNLIVLALNDFFIIFMLNLPLVVGLTMGGHFSKLTQKFSAASVWKSVGGVAGGFAGRNSIGWVASTVDKRLGNTKFGNSLIMRDLRSVTTGAAAKGKYGGARSFQETKDEQKKVDQKQKEMDRKNRFISSFNEVKAGSIGGHHDLSVKKEFGNMASKERLDIIKDNLKDEKGLSVLVKNMRREDFEAIKKSDDFTEEQKGVVMEARGSTLKKMAGDGETETVKNMLSNMSDEDKKAKSTNIGDVLSSAISSQSASSSDTVGVIVDTMTGKELGSSPSIIDRKVISNLSVSQLEDMVKSKADPAILDSVARSIMTWKKNPSDKEHRAAPWINKNKEQWLIQGGGTGKIQPSRNDFRS